MASIAPSASRCAGATCSSVTTARKPIQVSTDTHPSTPSPPRDAQAARDTRHTLPAHPRSRATRGDLRGAPEAPRVRGWASKRCRWNLSPSVSSTSERAVRVAAAAATRPVSIQARTSSMTAVGMSRCLSPHRQLTRVVQAASKPGDRLAHGPKQETGPRLVGTGPVSSSEIAAQTSATAPGKHAALGAPGRSTQQDDTGCPFVMPCAVSVGEQRIRVDAPAKRVKLLGHVADPSSARAGPRAGRRRPSLADLHGFNDRNQHVGVTPRH